MSDTRDKPKKKKHGCLTTLLVFLVVIVVAIGGGFLYFRSQAPDDVIFTEADVLAFNDKMGINSGDYAFDLMAFMNGDVIAEGSHAIDAQLTSAEITAGFRAVASFVKAYEAEAFALEELTLIRGSMLPLFNTDTNISDFQGSGILANVNVRFTGDDELEIFANLTPRISDIYAYAPDLESYAFAIESVVDSLLYCKMTLTHNPSGGFSMNVLELTVSGIPVPRRLIDRYQGDFIRQINRSIDRIETFDIEIFKVTSGNLHFKGHIPGSIKNMN